MDRARPLFSIWMSLGLAAVLLMLSGTACAQPAANAQQEPKAQEKSDGDVLAVVGGVEVTRGQVETKAAGDFETLHVERMQFEAEQKQKRHDAVLRHLEEMVADRVLNLEAEAQGISRPDLLEAQVYSKVTEPTEDEIAQIYEINKNRLRQPLENVRGQIADFLKGRQRETELAEYIDELKLKYEVVQKIEPFRYDIEAEGHPSAGPGNAPVVLVEFSDFECPYCTRMNSTLNEVTAKFGDKVQRVFRQFPLNGLHPNAQRAAEASLCAHEQGKFWEMHGRLFERPTQLSSEDILTKAADIGLDKPGFEGCLNSGRYKQRVEDDLQKGRIVGVTGTPALFINGRPVRGAASVEQVSQLVEEELKMREDQ